MELSREDIKNIFDVDIAFGTTKCMPEIEEIPKEYFQGNLYTTLVDAIFFGRPIPSYSFEVTPHFDDATILEDMPRFVRAHLVSRSCGHEHKIAGVAFLISQVMQITNQ